MTHDSELRSIGKSVSYRILILAMDAVIIFFVTRRADITIWLVVLTNIGSTALYYLHERVWERTGWGRRSSL